MELRQKWAKKRKIKLFHFDGIFSVTNWVARRKKNGYKKSIAAVVVVVDAVKFIHFNMKKNMRQWYELCVSMFQNYDEDTTHKKKYVNELVFSCENVYENSRQKKLIVTYLACFAWVVRECCFCHLHFTVFSIELCWTMKTRNKKLCLICAIFGFSCVECKFIYLINWMKLWPRD